MGDLTITISLQDLLVLVMMVLGIVALIYFIIILARLTPAMKSLQNIMQDAEQMTSQAKGSMESVSGIVSDLTQSASGLNEIISGNKSGFKAATNLVNAMAGLVGIVRSGEKSEKTDKK